MILVLSMYYSIIVCYVYKKFVHENYEIWLIWWISDFYQCH